MKTDLGQLIKKYKGLYEDIESGKEALYVAKDGDDFLDQLYGRKNPVQQKVS